MIKTKHTKMGKRLIVIMKEIVDHVEGRTALAMRYVEVPEDVCEGNPVKAGALSSRILTAPCRQPALAVGNGSKSAGIQKARCAST
jgi:hypothetical protein